MLLNEMQKQQRTIEGLQGEHQELRARLEVLEAVLFAESEPLSGAGGAGE